MELATHKKHQDSAKFRILHLKRNEGLLCPVCRAALATHSIFKDKMAVSEGPCLEALLASQFHTASFLWERNVFEEMRIENHTRISLCPAWAWGKENGGKGEGARQCSQYSGVELGSACFSTNKAKHPSSLTVEDGRRKTGRVEHSCQCVSRFL